MKKLTREEEKKLTQEEYREYYYALRYQFEQSRINNLSLETRRKLYPLLSTIIKLRNKISGYDLTVLNDRRKITDRPRIYAVTHICKEDIEVVSEVINEHFYLLCGDFESLHDTIDGMFLGLNGVLYFNEKDKADRNNVKQRMKETLNKAGNLLYFPEGTWNLSPNLLLNKCYYGIIEVALETNAIIVPIALEQYGKNFMANVGENFDVNNYICNNIRDTKINAITDLRDKLATLKWEIFEALEVVKRSEISDDYYQCFLNERIGHWPTLSFEDFIDAIYKDKEIVSADEVFEPIKKLEYKKETQFLFKR